MQYISDNNKLKEINYKYVKNDGFYLKIYDDGEIEVIANPQNLTLAEDLKIKFDIPQNPLNK